jgi:RNA polymerase sigma-70 factor, ECF subfamily
VEQDASLLDRIAAGDEPAVTECLDRYGDLVWSVARRYCDSAADAEDACQEIFVDLWQSAGRFDPSRGSEVTFVMVIARRRLIDRRRRSARRLQPAGLEPTVEPADQRTSLPLEIREEAAMVEQAIDELKPEQSQILRMAIIDGLSQSEIATRIEMPIGTVKSHARRGMERLRSVIQSRNASPSGGDR